MAVTDSDESRVVRLLSQDVAATIGAGHEERIHDAAARVRTFCDDLEDYAEKVVGDVQQDFHDLFIDITWPACPFHPHHPLWLHDGYWVCESSRRTVAPLGELRGNSPSARTI